MSSRPAPPNKPSDKFVQLDRNYTWPFFLFCGLGLLLRLLWLGRASLQIDEIVTIRDALAQPDVATIYHTELQRFFWYRVLPLFMVPIHWVGQFWGVNAGFPPEWVLRLPGAVVSTLMLPLLYGLTRDLAGRRTGLVALLLAAVSPFHLYYAREAYAYGYLMFFSTGLLWCSLRLLATDWRIATAPWRWLLGYLFFASGYLQTHLTALVFLSVWTPVLAVALLWNYGWRALWRRANFLLLGITASLPYILFLPFLLRLLSSGYKSTDASAITYYFSAGAVRTLVGRMGWGESWWSLTPFLLVLGWGLYRFMLARRDRTVFVGGLVLLAQLVLYVGFQAAYQVQTNSRFEVRYFSSVFPILMVFAATGMESLFRWFFVTADPAGARLASRRIQGSILGGALAIWLLLSVGLVLALQSRGVNYKSAARWIQQHVPVDGVYANMSIYEMRGVPQAYPTPDRNGTFVSANSTEEDARRYLVPDLTREMFALCPSVYLLEIWPLDLLMPEIGMPPIPRDELFVRHVWLTDPAWEWLVRLKTLPPGERQLNSIMPKLLISWNEPGDLQSLAVRNDRLFYHSWGPQWRYVKQTDGTPRMNFNWMGLAGAGQLFVGNTAPESRHAAVRLSVFAPPPGCRVTVRGPASELLIANMDLAGGQGRLEIPAVNLSPGTNTYTVQVQPITIAAAGALYVNRIEISPSPAAASSN